jgi:hypothetical protein
MATKFLLEFNCDNDAFKNGKFVPEIERILKEITYQVSMYKTSGGIKDVNGNFCGLWGIQERKEGERGPISEAYVLLTDDRGTMSSTEIPFGLGVKTEEEAKRFVKDGGVGYTHSYAKITIFNNKDDGINWRFRGDGRDPWAKEMDKK